MMRKNQGFTLVELMIVVAIIAIIAAVAIPSYNSSIEKTRRKDAMGALTGFANSMERHFTDNTSYLGAGVAGIDTGPPAIFPQFSPAGGSTRYYALTIDAATATNYTLRATPIGSQTGNGIIEIDSTGLRQWDESNTGVMVNWDSR